MKRITEFLAKWGGIIALALIIAGLGALFILCECKCDSPLLRSLAGFATLPLAGVGLLAILATIKSDRT